MNRMLQRALDRIMNAFVGSGIEIDVEGRLWLPDGLCPERVHRFVEVCLDERYTGPREAMAALFLRLGVSARAVQLLDEIIAANGDVEFGVAARRTPALMAALPEFKRIPSRFRDFLVRDLELASESCRTLDEAVVQVRESLAVHLECPPEWDAILGHADALTDLTQTWRERPSAA